MYWTPEITEVPGRFRVRESLVCSAPLLFAKRGRNVAALTRIHTRRRHGAIERRGRVRAFTMARVTAEKPGAAIKCAR